MNITNTGRRRLLQAGLCLGCGLMIPGKASAGSIHDLSGTVYINKHRASLSDVVRPGDVVSTSRNGRIDFSVDGDAFRLGEFSSIRIGTSDNPVISALQLFTGKLLSVFAPGRPRNIITPTVTMGIRGTGCYIDTTPSSTFCCTCYGKTEVIAGHQRIEYDAVHHKGGQFDFEGRELVGIGPGEMRGHTDDDLRQLERYVGRVPLFDQVKSSNS